LHPGVDDVVHVVELGGTHQEGGLGGGQCCGDGGDDRDDVANLYGLRAHCECVSIASMEDHKTRVNTNDYAFVTDIYT
jgi:hypothetical protein